jgi:N-acetylglucosaminyldiphosphoundecaprenol N-acetyl-beta-D-mannosaminyltransferase
MSLWLTEETRSAAPTEPLADAATRCPPGLPRAVDVLLACALLLLLGPLLLLVWRWRWSTPVRGLDGRPFQRWSAVLPVHGGWRVLRALGLNQAPVLLNIVRGEMAWVGPRPRNLDEAPSPAERRMRPGLINPWFIRRRTAVDFGSEADADLHHLRHRSPLHDLGLLLRGAIAALLPMPTRAAAPQRVAIADVAFDNVNMDEALDRVNALLDGDTAHQVSFVNAACVNIAARHRGYRRALARAALVLPDGIGVRLGTSLLGQRMKQNVNGTDLFPRLCDLLNGRAARLFLLGGAPGVAEQVAAVIAQRWPAIQVVGLRDGYFGVAGEGAVATAVRASGADLLLVARGVPSQDLFIDRYLPQLGVKVAMGVGGLFEFVSGRIPRAPLWMRESGLEWTWRLWQEPTRLWRRYLIGNLSFLGRVALQRIGWRAPAADRLIAPPADAGAMPKGGVRAVIFATPRVQADMPLPADHLTALLPLAGETLIERLMRRMAQAEIFDVDLVVCDQPDALRTLLGDGSRWGLRLHWHLVKDPEHPYGALDRRALRSASQLVIGHADRCPSVDSLRELATEAHWRIEVRDGRCATWSGWASLPPSWLPPRCAPLDAEALDSLSSRARWPQRLHTSGGGRAIGSAEGLVEAQMAIVDVPGSWIERAWGVMSPLAQVDERATLIGPLRIGPGCVVEAGARLGPRVLLSQDVVVSAGSQLSHCVVLPGSYIGADLTLADAVVNGPRVRHLRLGVEARLAESDGLLMHLQPHRPSRGSWLGRALAGLILLGLGPLLAVHLVWRCLQGRGPDWQPLRAVVGPADGRPGLVEQVLRAPVEGASRQARAWAWAAGVIDVLQGRRAWIGVRARCESEWYALRPEWKSLLAHRPIGLLTAPAWYDSPSLQTEACAAADVFAVVLPPLRRAALILGGSHRPATVR